ncbi:MAG: 50S ribosomal protein L9 [Candidatus Omnitrophica bacterium]|jgi:large subunit ribosomal protein L9|nr:50S ribosomal protein L9 [Candidatus Omnitrophota bacterium]MDD5660651.1 50S ribosomal protein L9 [Candidatus Omnitrophota bacterium]
MEVILNQDVEKIGRKGTVVQVKEGFARNFLFPHNLAKPATADSLKKLEQEKQIRLAQFAKAKEEATQIKKRLSELSLTIAALTQAEEKLYGSIHAGEISEALKEEGFSVDKSNIELAEPIKSLGIYEVPVKLHPEVTAAVKLWVVKK